MSELNTKQAGELAQLFSDLAAELLDYRDKNWDSLPDTERSSLKALQESLVHFSYDLTIEAIRRTLGDVAQSLERITQAKGKMVAALKKLNDINKVLGLAAAAVQLGAAVVTGQPVAIAAAIENALTAAKTE